MKPRTSAPETRRALRVGGALAGLAAAVALSGCTNQGENSGSWSALGVTESYSGPGNFVVTSLSSGTAGETAELAGCAPTRGPSAVEGVVTLGTGFSIKDNTVTLTARNVVYDTGRFGVLPPLDAAKLQDPAIHHEMEKVEPNIETSHHGFKLVCAKSVQIADTEFITTGGVETQAQIGDVMNEISPEKFMVLLPAPAE